MKLIYCQSCQDVIRLITTKRTCLCGACSGLYIEDLDAVYTGIPAVPLGFSNMSFAKALKERPDSGKGKTFEAFVIPRDCPTMEYRPE